MELPRRGETMADVQSNQKSDRSVSLKQLSRYAVALVIVGAVVLYLVEALRGRIQRIDSGSVALLVVTGIVVVFVITPGVMDRLSQIEVSGIKFELLKREQLRQRNELDEFSLIFPILLPESERHHLMNLAYQRTTGYKGNHDVRTELRRLRSIGLIRMMPDQQVSQIKDGSTVDLAKYVGLTNLGRRWVQRIEDAEREEAIAAGAAVTDSGTSRAS